MVDFKKILQNMIEKMTPEERARYDAKMADEARYNLTKQPINARFERILSRNIRSPFPGGHKKNDTYETYVAEEWEKNIHLRIEDRVSHDGTKYEVIQFIGGSTGHESYKLDKDFVENMQNWSEDHDTFCICAGSVNYFSCSVSITDVNKYIKEQRPELLPEVHGMSPSN